MESAKITDAKAFSFEDQFGKLYPNYQIREQPGACGIHSTFHLSVDGIMCADSGIREFAFKYALQDLRTGKLVLPNPPLQMELWPQRD
jgi:hypothetical protein